ncbi:MAG: polyprenyl glycosylphosphotransferase, partial [Terriglobales bacterium]
MIRLFHVYYPIRTLILLLGEALIVWTSFLVAAVLVLREDSYLVLNYEGGYIKLFIFTAVVLLCSHWFDLYDTSRFSGKGELFFRLFMVLGMLAFVTAGISYFHPAFLIGGNSTALGLFILTVALFGWRMSYGWLV